MAQNTVVLPNHVDAENALLGSLLIDSDYLLDCDYLEASDFYITRNGRVFEVIKSIASQGKTPDMLTVQAELEQRGWLDEPTILTDYTLNAIYTSQAGNYAEIIFSASLRRQLIQKSADATKAAFSDTETNSVEILSEAIEALASIDATKNRSGGIVTMSQAANLFYDNWERLQAGGESGIPSGIKSLDRMLTGFMPNQCYLLAGRPGMGKSALAIEIARYVAMQGKRVLFFSLEMSETKVFTRIVAQTTGLSYDAIAQNKLSDEDRVRVLDAADQASQLPIEIDATPAMTIAAIRNIAKKRQMTHGLDMVIIDHVGIARPDIRLSNAYEKANYIADAVMALPKQLGVPVLALSQLSREVEHRADKRPQLSDLRDSGKWEENADAVLFVYRDGYYNDDTATPNLADIIVAKNRDGRLGVAETYCKIESMRFTDLGTEVKQLNDEW